MIGKFDLQADADKVRAMIEDMASTYQEAGRGRELLLLESRAACSDRVSVLEDQMVDKLLEAAT